MKIKLCTEGSMGSPGRRLLHCIGPQPPALWPPCSSPLSRSDWNASFAKYSLISRRWNPVCDRGPALPRSSSGATFQTFLMGGAHNHAGALKYWSRPIWKMEKGVGQRARVGGGPYWAGLDLGVQVYVVRLSLHFTKLKQFNPEAWPLGKCWHVLMERSHLHSHPPTGTWTNLIP